MVYEDGKNDSNVQLTGCDTKQYVQDGRSLEMVKYTTDAFKLAGSIWYEQVAGRLLQVTRR